MWADLLEERRAARAPATANGETKAPSEAAAKVRAAVEKARAPEAAPVATEAPAEAAAPKPANDAPPAFTLGDQPPATTAKAPRKSLEEQKAEARALVDQAIVTLREYTDLVELEQWAAGWKSGKARAGLAPALRQEVDKALDQHRAALRASGQQEEPGAGG